MDNMKDPCSFRSLDEAWAEYARQLRDLPALQQVLPGVIHVLEGTFIAAGVATLNILQNCSVAVDAVAFERFMEEVEVMANDLDQRAHGRTQ